MEITDQHIANITFISIALDREARGESSLGKLAIAFSIMNRVNDPTWWGKSVMDVVTKKWQYSSITAPRDPNLTEWPNDIDPIKKPIWEDCFLQAKSAYFNLAINPVPLADSYFDISIKAPVWATNDKLVKQIGRIKFYNLREPQHIHEQTTITNAA